MSNKKLIIIIIALAILVVANVIGIFIIDDILAKPIASHSVEVFGASFAERVDGNVIDINLIRPPRQVVYPGTTNAVNATITNTYETPIYIRAQYRIDIEDGNGNQTIGLHDEVSVSVSENWFYHDGYWYFEDAVDANCAIPCLITSIYYSELFENYMDHNVYIPVIVESVTTNGESVYDATGWKNIDIQSINPHDYLPTDISWTQSVTIIG